jgi:hypothetical protein
VCGGAVALCHGTTPCHQARITPHHTTPHHTPHHTPRHGSPQVGINYSDKTSVASVDAEKGAFKLGYDFKKDVRVG